MPRAVLDTTVAVSAFVSPLPRGAAHELLLRCRSGEFELCLSEAILAELNDVLLTRRHLRRRFQYTDADVIEFGQQLARMASLVQEVPELSVVRDPADNMVLACAVAAGADYLVTRDKDLLVLGQHAGIRIVTPEDFLAWLRQASAP
jgi:putative PIN family toxin of toxin-antitoxin system